MTQFIHSLTETLHTFDVAVLDQWGVLHDGSTAYPSAVAAMKMLSTAGKEILVLSNSGKRSTLNLQRIEKIGLRAETITRVVTSGEALWEDINDDRLSVRGTVPRKIFPICEEQADAIDWAGGCSKIEIVDRLCDSVDVVLLMGLPDGTLADQYDAVFQLSLRLQTPLICSNPDKTSPRASGLVISPGALADQYEAMGGQVIWYGKPHAAVYRSVTRSFPALNAERFLMVGDSLEHDIAGRQNVGFSSAFIRGGIHAGDYADVADDETIAKVTSRLSAQAGVKAPDVCLQFFA